MCEWNVCGEVIEKQVGLGGGYVQEPAALEITVAKERFQNGEGKIERWWRKNNNKKKLSSSVECIVWVWIFVCCASRRWCLGWVVVAFWRRLAAKSKRLCRKRWTVMDAKVMLNFYRNWVCLCFRCELLMFFGTWPQILRFLFKFPPKDMIMTIVPVSEPFTRESPTIGVGRRRWDMNRIDGLSWHWFFFLIHTVEGSCFCLWFFLFFVFCRDPPTVDLDGQWWL